MTITNRTYIAIDLKSFYASVECLERQLDPLTTNLVVADGTRTQKTICLAVTPSLKEIGVKGRPRLFEVSQKVKEENIRRKERAPHGRFEGSSYNKVELSQSPQLELDFITATPRMAKYIEYSTKIYNIYLKYVAPEDIHVYSIDEVFMDITQYLPTANMTPRAFAKKILKDVDESIGVTATCGIGTNLYLSKIAMDIVAKHIPSDKDGVRIAQLDEMSYRKLLWTHRPLTDFWRVGRGYTKKLESHGIYTMGDIARCSIGDKKEYYNEDLLYKIFGINAELLIDHAWGYEPCTIADVKAYKPETKSIGSGQVLQYPYTYEKAKLIVREMTDLLALDLVDKGMVTDQIVLHVGYDIDNLTNPEIKKKYKGPVKTDYYGRQVPRHAHGSVNLEKKTSSTKLIIDGVMDLFEQIVNKDLLVRRVNLSANHVVSESEAAREKESGQMDLFQIFDEAEIDENEIRALEREKKMQKAILDIKKRYGKNAIVKGMNLEEGAMTMNRNKQIGGHKA